MSSPNPYAINADTLSGMKPLRKVVYCLGSNLGERMANLQGGIDAIRDTPDVMVVDISSVYETKPVGAPEDSPDFLNLVIVAETTLEPRTLLERALAVEDAFGRKRSKPGAPRTLDVDLIVVGDVEMDTEDLKVPHPRAHLRPFVLVPWAEVDPLGTIPGRGTVNDLLAEVDVAGMTRRNDLVVED